MRDDVWDSHHSQRQENCRKERGQLLSSKVTAINNSEQLLQEAGLQNRQG